MAKRSGGIGRPKPDVQIDSHYSFDERERDGIEQGSFVMGSADHGYGYVDGFRYGITSTGYRNRETALGRKARGD